MESQLKRGVMVLCLLQLLNKEPQYGYALVKEMQKFFPDTDESTLYAILRRVNNNCYTEMYYGDTTNGPKRKYYRITAEGKEHLEGGVNFLKKILLVFQELQLEL